MSGRGGKRGSLDKATQRSTPLPPFLPLPSLAACIASQRFFGLKQSRTTAPIPGHDNLTRTRPPDLPHYRVSPRTPTPLPSLALPSMNSLPTELLSTIIDYAASCDSTEESYRSRLELLSSLALVNRALHQIAQPLLSRKVIIKSDKQWLSSKGPTFQAAIESLASREYQHAVLTLIPPHHFAGLREMRIIDGEVPLRQLGSLPRKQL